MELGPNPANMSVKTHWVAEKFCSIRCSWLDPKTLSDIQLSVKRPNLNIKIFKHILRGFFLT